MGREGKQEANAPSEGWMAEAPLHCRRYHYIRGGMALCGKWGLYRGSLVPHAPGSPKGNEDCAGCYRRLGREMKGRAPRSNAEVTRG